MRDFCFLDYRKGGNLCRGFKFFVIDVKFEGNEYVFFFVYDKY